MGLPGFYKILKHKNVNYEPKNMKVKGFSAIDTMVYLRCAKCYAYGSKNKYKFIDYFIRMIINFLMSENFPIFVFDGKRSHLKGGELNMRSNILNKNKLKLDETKKNILNFKIKRSKMFNKLPKFFKKRIKHNICMYSNDYFFGYNNYVKKKKEFIRRDKNLSVNPTKEDIKNLKYVIKNLGFPLYTIDNYEAESFCGFLSRNKYVDYVFTNDSDIILSATNFIKNYKNSLKTYDVYFKNEILEKMKFNEEELFIFALMIGTDFNKKFKLGMGHVRCRNFILQNKDKIKIIIEKRYGIEKINKIKNYILYNFPNINLSRLKKLKEIKNFKSLIKNIYNKENFNKVLSLLNKTILIKKLEKMIINLSK
jgi:hypothetical protein